MKARFTKRKLEVFSLHATTDGKQIDYKNLFEDFSEIKDEQRNIQDDEKLIAVPFVEIKGNFVFMTEEQRGLAYRI